MFLSQQYNNIFNFRSNAIKIIYLTLVKILLHFLLILEVLIFISQAYCSVIKYLILYGIVLIWNVLPKHVILVHNCSLIFLLLYAHLLLDRAL